MHPTRHIPSPIQFWDSIHGILGQRTATSKTCPLKKPGFSIVFNKSWPAKKFRPPKISAPINYNIATTAKQ